MTSSATAVSLGAPASVESEVSLVRLYLMRGMYLLLAIGGGIAFLPQLTGDEPTARRHYVKHPGTRWHQAP